MSDFTPCQNSHWVKGDMPHDFIVIKMNEEVQVEVCQRCGQKEVYYKDTKGRIENKKYLRDHARDFAQPNGASDKLFKRLYAK